MSDPRDAPPGAAFSHWCPRCGSDRVMGGKVTLDHPDPSGEGWIRLSGRERGCLSCGLQESRFSDDPDWGEWAATWNTPPGPAPPPEPEPPDPDGPFPVPTPAPFAALLDDVRRSVEAAGEPPAAAGTWLRPLSLVGLPWQDPAVAFTAPPELVPFAELLQERCGFTGDLGSGHAYLGWIVPAPELGAWDHPVGLVDAAEPAVVHQLGPDTRAGFRRYVELLVPESRLWSRRQATSAEGLATWAVVKATGDDVDALMKPLGIRWGWTWNPGPWRGTATSFATPPGWRHERGTDGIGVLAPVEAFADQPPEPTPDRAAADAARLLDAGAPASALWLVKEVFARSHEPGRRFGELRPLWARAYADLGRPQLHARLDAMAYALAAAEADSSADEAATDDEEA
jgi:hypothetical protein